MKTKTIILARILLSEVMKEEKKKRTLHDMIRAVE